MKKYWLVLSLLFICSLTVYSQLKYSGQLFSRPLYVNAAYSGNDKAPRLVYSNLTFAKTFYHNEENYASFDVGFKSSGIGAEYLNVNESYIRSQVFKLLYAHEFEAGDFKIRPAFSAGIFSQLFDYKKRGMWPYLVENGDTLFFPDQQRNTLFTAGAGAMVLYKDLTLGLYVDQLNKPELERRNMFSTKLYPQFMLHADYRFRIGEIAEIIPAIVFYSTNLYNSNHMQSYIDPSLRLRISIVEVGISKTLFSDYIDATSMSAGLVWKYFRLKYSYTKRKADLPISGADHEFTFAVSLKK